MTAPASTDLVTCPACGAQNFGDARFCNQCGITIRHDSIRSGVAAREPARVPTRAGHTAPGQDKPRPDRADPLVGMVIADRYRIVEPIGRGGMGVVYRAEHARIGKLMAIKLLAGELSRSSDLVARFKREALAVSKLSHPNTVQVFDFGTADGLTYLAMELLNGQDLGRVIARGGPLSAPRTAKIVVQICSSLAEAHDIGMVHRDLKPENIMLLPGRGGDEIVKVCDFGLAKLRESSELGEVTTRGEIVGTPYYMSPEQVRGEAVDARSDIYALGALTYTTLTGNPPFDAGTPMGVLTKHLTEDVVPPHERFPKLGIPPAVGDVVVRALQKDPNQRFGDVRKFQTALVEGLRGSEAISVDSLLDSKRVRPLAQLDADAATRDEVERYERRLRRRGLATKLSLVVILCAAGVGGWKLWQRATFVPQFDGKEREPNSSAASAQTVPFGEPVTGQLGKRLDAKRSDRDFFAVHVPDDTPAVSLELSALPNIATCAWVYRAGLSAPLGRYCAGQPGRDLNVPALELAGGDYLIAVMQDRDRYLEAPPPPVYENVSDNYRLRVSRGTIEPGSELEPNDARDQANRVRVGETLTGALTWMRDEDFVCAAPGSGSVRFIAEDVPDRPRSHSAVLRVTPLGGPDDGVPVRVHRPGTLEATTERDVHGPWTSAPVEATGERAACLRIQLVPNPHAPRPHPLVAPASDAPWSVTLVRAAAP